MKKSLVAILLILCLVVSGCASRTEGEETPADPNQAAQGETKDGAGVEISCMSFNVLSNGGDPNTFLDPTVRAKYVLPFLMECEADIIGLQEIDTQTHFPWKDYILEGTKDKYASRCIDEEFEFGTAKMQIGNGLVILYRKDRFELLESGCSYYFEDSNRWYQYVLLKDNKSGREVVVTNTHFSINPYIDEKWDLEEGNYIRSMEAEELAAFWEDYVGDRALFATGDYNAERGMDPHEKYLRAGRFDNSLELALESDGEVWLDFCYVNPACMQINKYDFMPRDYVKEDGTKIIMSDHYPIMTYAEFK